MIARVIDKTNSFEIRKRGDNGNYLLTDPKTGGCIEFTSLKKAREAMGKGNLYPTPAPTRRTA